MDPMVISKEWAQRPADQRYLSVEDLHQHNLHKRAASVEVGAALDHARLAPSEAGGLALAVPEQEPAMLTHWSFGQLCSRVGAPAGYLRSLPAVLAAIPLQWSLEQERQDAKVLYRKPNGQPVPSISAVTSDTYGRIYDAEVSGAVLKHLDLDTWKVPAASYASKDPQRATTLYASDRDCFICLVDERSPITVPGAEQDTLYRGFLVRNSEVGAATLEMSLFLYRRICDNRIIHGLGQSTTLRIRHTSGGPMRFMRELQPELKRYLTAGTQDVVGTIVAAKAKEVAKTEADAKDWLRERGFTQALSQQVVEQAAAEEGNARSVWNLVQGASAIARDMSYGDQRYELERQAGKLLNGITR